MDSLLLQHLQTRIATWRAAGYPGAYRETQDILAHCTQQAFLYGPQREALETYIYLKEVLDNRPTPAVVRALFPDDKALLRALDLPAAAAFELLGDPAAITRHLETTFGTGEYVNQVYALTMGSGKTLLMATLLAYEFVLADAHPDDTRFARNVLIFAPDTTIIESLKEIRTFDYRRVLPRACRRVLLALKYHYLERPDTALTPIGAYNVIVSNSQKIILKTRQRLATGPRRLLADSGEQARREIENARLHAIRHLERLAVFVDEAHHAYGSTLAGSLKKTRQTIAYLHRHTPLVGVVNLTGTPYVNNRLLPDVVYHFGMKAGIECGILKPVKILDYGEVRSARFVEEVVTTFLNEYGQRRLEGRLPKLAFYAASIAELQEELRPTLERILARHGVPLDSVLEYHTAAEAQRSAFLHLDTPASPHRFVLLVGKGTEGWNCRSLVACALYRTPKSAIFVLQAVTRCLRRIGDRPVLAHIFLSRANYAILDRELKQNFALDIATLQSQTPDPTRIEHTLTVEKRRTLTVQKPVRTLVSAVARAPEDIRIDLSGFDPAQAQTTVAEGGLLLNAAGQAVYHSAQATRTLRDHNDLTYYEIIGQLHRATHLPCLILDRILHSNGLERDTLVAQVNTTPGLLAFIVQSVLGQAFRYEEAVTTVTETLELTRRYPFRLQVAAERSALVVYREDEEQAGGRNRLGFHINPYCFDSGDERELFRYLRQVLEPEETIRELYFTGGVADAVHNDFHFAYWSPSQQRLARYFPDFLIETSRGRFVVVEVKSSQARAGYEANRRRYTGQREELTDEVFAKEVGFAAFAAVNRQFEYRIVFDAALQQAQLALKEALTISTPTTAAKSVPLPRPHPTPDPSHPA